jgi:hypothetical protein
MSLDLRMAEDHGLPPIAIAHPAFTVAAVGAPAVLDSVEAAPPPPISSATAQPTNEQMLAYIRSVAERVDRLRTST